MVLHQDNKVVKCFVTQVELNKIKQKSAKVLILHMS